MLSKETRNKIRIMIQDDDVSSEIISRLSIMHKLNSGRSVENALKQLDISQSMNERIKNSLHSKMANYDHGRCGSIIADTLVGMADVLNALKENKKIEGVFKGIPLDRISLEALSLALSSNEAAKNFEKVYDLAVESTRNINPKFFLYETKPKIEESLPLEILVDAKQETIHTEKRSTHKVVVKRIHFKNK